MFYVQTRGMIGGLGGPRRAWMGRKADPRNCGEQLHRQYLTGRCGRVHALTDEDLTPRHRSL